MTEYARASLRAGFYGIIVFAMFAAAHAAEPCRVIMPEQRRIEIRSPQCLPPLCPPQTPAPITVSDLQLDAPSEQMSLDGAIRIALCNSEVIRVLGGSSGQTIYDPAITNTQIDQKRGRFDPKLQLDNSFYKTETPTAEFDTTDPSKVLIDGTRRNDYNMGLELSKTNNSGGTAALGVNTNPTRWADVNTLPLNPSVPSNVELSLTQPLLQGGGYAVNMAPIEIARIDTERSFFQMKNAVQKSVRDVVEAYWSLVRARTELWARRKQVEQGTWGYKHAEARLRSGLGSRADVAQAKSALANYRAGLISAQADVLQREDVLRNILGLPASVPPRIIPVTPPSMERIEVDWETIINVAAQRRPDLIELKLIIEADQQQLLISDNQAKPQLNAVALYRWNGLEGRTPAQAYEISGPGQFTDWTLGVNFSVPLGLRQGRAALRQQQLVIMRDRANLQQALHNSMHTLATNYRNLAQYYDLYLAYKETRAAAAVDLDAQSQIYAYGPDRNKIYLNVLQAITSWGNAVSSEAQSLAQYNTELAALQQQTGVILEEHGIRFVEERYGSIGPLGRLASPRCYPKAEQPCPDGPRYPNTGRPAEDAFNLQDPVQKINHRMPRSTFQPPVRLPAQPQPTTSVTGDNGLVPGAFDPTQSWPNSLSAPRAVAPDATTPNFSTPSETTPTDRPPIEPEDPMLINPLPSIIPEYIPHPSPSKR